jgi:branched-chain amino acid transport system substrate-binding protein
LPDRRVSGIVAHLPNRTFRRQKAAMLMPRRRTLLQAGVALTVTSAGVSWGQAPAGRKIILGQSVPLTGAASEIGLAFAAGAKLYVDAFNGRKNAPGWTLELRQLDDGYDATRAAANARKLLADGADVLFGFVGTASAEAGAAVARSENAIFFAPFAASDTLREATSNHVFHVRPA